MVRRKREEERGAATGAVTKSTDAAAAGASGTGPSPADVRPDQLRLGMQPWMVDGLHPSIRQMLDFKNASRGEIVHRRKINWAQLLGSSEVNTGDTAVQSALLLTSLALFFGVSCCLPPSPFLFPISAPVATMTEKIRNLVEHMRANHKDMHTRHSLDQLLNRRRRLMWYLRRKNYPRYAHTIEKLQLTDVPPPLQ